MYNLFKHPIILIFLLFFTLSFTLFASEPALKGIDISEWQGAINFESVKEDGIEVVYIRAGEGSDYEDAYFTAHYEGARTAHLKIGFYHYVTATSTEEAKVQAQYFANLIKDKHMDCRPAMDFESFGNLSENEINAIAHTYLDTLTQLTHITPLIYTDEYNAANLWLPSLNQYPLWIAEYDVTTPSSLGHWNNWSGFQYSDTGNIKGIIGPVDLDYFRETTLITETVFPTPDSKPTPPVISNYFTYIVQPADTLSALASRFHTTIQALVKLNHIPNPNLIYIGQTLKIPKSPSSSEPSKPITPTPDDSSFIDYTVQPGDNLSTIAQTYHTTVNTLVKLNHIANPNLIYINQILKIPTRTSNLPEAPSRTYVVQPGDTLLGIAIRYHTTVSNLVMLNHISNPNLIYVGQILIL